MDAPSENDDVASSDAFRAALEEQLPAPTVALASLLEKVGREDDLTLSIDEPARPQG